jgi:aminoglycoside phosphotransferase (APT) family kinase protein
MKVSARTTSTEADALRFLQTKDPSIPAPRVFDSITAAGKTFTIMTRLPGRLLIDFYTQLSREEMSLIIADITAVLHKLERLKRSDGRVMMSASGHGLPDPHTFFEADSGPHATVLDCWAAQAGFNSVDEFVAEVDDSVPQALVKDPVVWVHSDLRMYNVLVHGGRLSGIIDWENSGWLPQSWQLHVLRFRTAGSRLAWKDIWDTTKFSDETEAAYQASLSFLVTPL